jgi:hypothetical protein
MSLISSVSVIKKLRKCYFFTLITRPDKKRRSFFPRAKLNYGFCAADYDSVPERQDFEIIGLSSVKCKFESVHAIFCKQYCIKIIFYLFM